MNKYKICVYAIAKNEEKFAERWANSMSEADEIVVLDTLSNDKTVEILSSFPKVRVYSQEIKPWRFDTARNIALEKVPEDADICVSTDLDEVFTPGWREKLEKALDEGAQQVRYRYTWSFNPDGSEGTVFWIDKIHSRKDFIWKHPVHEVITYIGTKTPKIVFAQGLQLNHFPDDSKSRGQYLPLLELSVKEEPEDDRNVHYLGREYMFKGAYDKAIETLKQHLELKSATWADERCASMRYIARCYKSKGNKKEALSWLLRACAQAPHLREPLIELGEIFYEEENWHGVITAINAALEIKERAATYITDATCWNEKPYDLLSLAYYFTGDFDKAIETVDKAISISGNNERINRNREFFIQAKERSN